MTRTTLLAVAPCCIALACTRSTDVAPVRAALQDADRAFFRATSERRAEGWMGEPQVRTGRYLATLALLVPPSRARAQDSASVRRLAWLAGCWEAASARRTIDEQWMPPRGTSMLGMSRTVRGDSLTEFEVVVLRDQGTRIAYEAHPSGQASAVFLSKTVGDSSVVFENLEHDFPQRIGYERHAADSLVAWIEGPAGGQTRRIGFPYRRARCG